MPEVIGAKGLELAEARYPGSMPDRLKQRLSGAEPGSFSILLWEDTAGKESLEKERYAKCLGLFEKGLITTGPRLYRAEETVIAVLVTDTLAGFLKDFGPQFVRGIRMAKAAENQSQGAEEVRAYGIRVRLPRQVTIEGGDFHRILRTAGSGKIDVQSNRVLVSFTLKIPERYLP